MRISGQRARRVPVATGVWIGVWIGVGMMISFVSLLVPTLAQNSVPASCRRLFDSANQARRAQGLPPLQWSDALASAASRHAAEMARENTISHQLPGEPSLPARAAQAGVKFVWIAENVDESYDAGSIHQRLMNSPRHRGNLLDPDMNFIGVGVAQNGGQIFTVEDFAKLK